MNHVSSLVRGLAVAALCVGFVGAAGTLVSCTAASTPAAAGSSGGPKLSCQDASLALSDDVIVGSLDGKAITYKDLGPELKRAEEKALRSYCDNIASARRIALDNRLTETLVEAEAKKQGMSSDDWVRAEVERRVPEPAEADVQAFYDAQKARMGDQLPPMEFVRPQVVAFLKREKSEAAVEEVVGGLLKSAKVERKLPDIRSPAADLKNAPHTPTKGKSGAKVQVVEFADFECPYCSRAADIVRELTAKYGDRVEFSYRHFPLRSIHPNAQRAAEISQCAGEQGKFWALHDALYQNQGALDEATVKAKAIEVGVDEGKLVECLSSGRAAAQVDADFNKGQEVGVEGTPSFFINGRSYSGNPSPSAIGAAIEEALGG